MVCGGKTFVLRNCLCSSSIAILVEKTGTTCNFLQSLEKANITREKIKYNISYFKHWILLPFLVLSCENQPRVIWNVIVLKIYLGKKSFVLKQKWYSKSLATYGKMVRLIFHCSVVILKGHYISLYDLDWSPHTWFVVISKGHSSLLWPWLILNTFILRAVSTKDVQSPWYKRSESHFSTEISMHPKFSVVSPPNGESTHSLSLHQNAI